MFMIVFFDVPELYILGFPVTFYLLNVKEYRRALYMLYKSSTKNTVARC